MFTYAVLVWMVCGAALLPDDIFAGNRTGFRIVAAGDLMVGSWAQQTIQEKGWSYPFRNLDTLLGNADLVFANLEAPFGEAGEAFEKSYTFRVAPDLVQVLKAGRINMVSLANNHIMDYGPQNLSRTMDLLKEHQIHYAGAGMNLQEARRPAVLQVNGSKIAFVSYSLTFPEEFWATDSSAGTCFPSHTFFYRDLKKIKQASDFLIVSFHWGSELMDSPKKYQKQLAHRTIDAGADLILGHHPHVIQGIEFYKKKPIVYSLGNYIFGAYSENVRESMILKLFYGTNGLQLCKIYPLYVYNKEVEFQPRIITGEEREQFFDKIRTLSLELNGQKDIVDDDGILRW